MYCCLILATYKIPQCKRNPWFSKIRVPNDNFKGLEIITRYLSRYILTCPSLEDLSFPPGTSNLLKNALRPQLIQPHPQRHNIPYFLLLNHIINNLKIV